MLMRQEEGGENVSESGEETCKPQWGEMKKEEYWQKTTANTDWDEILFLSDKYKYWMINIFKNMYTEGFT